MISKILLTLCIVVLKNNLYATEPIDLDEGMFVDPDTDFGTVIGIDLGTTYSW
jgi:hypothetical protein